MCSHFWKVRSKMPGQNVYDFAAPFGDSFQLKMENERLKSENAFLKAQLQSRPQLFLRTESDAQVLLDMADRDKAELALREQRAWQERDEALKEKAEMRSLLYLFSTDEAEPVYLRDTSYGEGYECERCDTWVKDYEIDHFPHAKECPWLRARALLDKEQKDGN